MGSILGSQLGCEGSIEGVSLDLVEQTSDSQIVMVDGVLSFVFDARILQVEDGESMNHVGVGVKNHGVADITETWREDLRENDPEMSSFIFVKVAVVDEKASCELHNGGQWQNFVIRQVCTIPGDEWTVGFSHVVVEESGQVEGEQILWRSVQMSVWQDVWEWP